MYRYTVHHKQVLMDGRRFNLHAFLELPNQDEIPEDERAYPTFADQIEDGLTEIEIEVRQTGDVFSVSVSDVLLSFPDADNGDYYMRQCFHLEIDHDYPLDIPVTIKNV